MEHHETFDAIERFVASWKEKDFAAILGLFRREYFWRIWVVQEITCAKKAEVHCGSKSIPWLDFLEIGNIIEKVKKAFQETTYHNRPAAKFSLMTGGPRNLIVHQMEGTSFQAPPLLGMLRSHAGKHSTNPHDKVYGVLGLTADRDTFGNIDYKRSPRATYVYTSCYLINKIRKLNVICVKQNDDNRYNLPSWVADWERRNLHPSHRVMGLQIREPPFTASGNEYTDAKFAEDGEILLASGFVIDTVTVVAQSLYVDGPESEVSQTLKVFHNWWVVFTNNISHNKEQIDIFQRTFCGGEWAPRYSGFEEHRVSLFFSLTKKLLPGLLKGSPVPTFERHESITAQDEHALVSSAALRMHAKRFIVSATKLIGLAPQDTEKGDKVVVLLGCDFPVVMRKMGDYWILIGEIYVDGIMYGEAMAGLQSGKYTKSEFLIR
ncbi:hypothetical protein BDZ45DRAFT_709407 [Acephala macrosclerotiorum]|nr:hypothetical protein BDZ45DRAFT_709407 [Acephala macrosclerotiorum]